MKRGLASPSSPRPWRRPGAGGSRSVRVVHMKLLKRRSGRPVRRLLATASSRSVAILATSRSLLASPNTKSTPLASHQAIRSSRAKPLSAQQNACARPAGADAGDHARHLLDRAGWGAARIIETPG